jgi:uncharacterized protein YkvS
MQPNNVEFKLGAMDGLVSEINEISDIVDGQGWISMIASFPTLETDSKKFLKLFMN